MDVMNAALGGMQSAQSSLERTAQRIAVPITKPSDAVDLSTEVVALLAARNEYTANAHVFVAGDKMQKKLLDILA